MQYQLQGDVVVHTSDDGVVTWIPPDPNNTDYAAYHAWVAEGNVAPVLDIPAPPAKSAPTLSSVQAQLVAIQAEVAQLVKGP
jgi:hypothetical protein